MLAPPPQVQRSGLLPLLLVLSVVVVALVAVPEALRP